MPCDMGSTAGRRHVRQAMRRGSAAGRRHVRRARGKAALWSAHAEVTWHPGRGSGARAQPGPEGTLCCAAQTHLGGAEQPAGARGQAGAR